MNARACREHEHGRRDDAPRRVAPHRPEPAAQLPVAPGADAGKDREHDDRRAGERPEALGTRPLDLEPEIGGAPDDE